MVVNPEATPENGSHYTPLVPGVFLLFFFFLRLLLFTHFGETPVAEILFPPIFS